VAPGVEVVAHRVLELLDVDHVFALATPIRSQKSRIASGVTPRRRSPERVGIRGSSQPSTSLLDQLEQRRLESTV
jgi:hypothetical protein